MWVFQVKKLVTINPRTVQRHFQDVSRVRHSNPRESCGAFILALEVPRLMIGLRVLGVGLNNYQYYSLYVPL